MATVCGPAPKSPFTVKACVCPLPFSAVTVWTPPTWTPSTVMVNAASPDQASSAMSNTSVSAVDALTVISRRSQETV
jgi:hypothetical protein